MSKREPQIEWQIIEDGAVAWPPPTRPDVDEITSEPPAHNHLYRRYGGALLVLLLLLAGSGLWLWRTAQAGVTQVEEELHDEAQAQLWKTTHGPGLSTTKPRRSAEASPQPIQFAHEEVTLAALQTVNSAEESGDALITELHVINLREKMAVVRIVTTAADGAQVYRQTRFYQRTVEGWQRAAPVAELWGAPRRIETTYFVFDFRQADAQVVTEVAAQADALYTTLYRNFGLAIPSPNQKIAIEVSVTAPPLTALLGFSGSWRIPAPGLYLAPEGLSESDILLQALLFPLLNHVLIQASRQYPLSFFWRWQHLWPALRLWQLWHLDLPLSAWRQEVVQWHMAKPQTGAQKQAPLLPSHYAALCALHGVWLDSPELIGIPLMCDERDTLPTYRVWALSLLQANPSSPSIYLEKLLPQDFWQKSVGRSERYWIEEPADTVALETFIEYVVATYGHERLPLLLAGLAQYDSWQTLAPSVFALSPSQLTTGWQRYLAAHYRVGQLY